MKCFVQYSFQSIQNCSGVTGQSVGKQSKWIKRVQHGAIPWKNKIYLADAHFMMCWEPLLFISMNPFTRTQPCWLRIVLTCTTGPQSQLPGSFSSCRFSSWICNHSVSLSLMEAHVPCNVLLLIVFRCCLVCFDRLGENVVVSGLECCLSCSRLLKTIEWNAERLSETRRFITGREQSSGSYVHQHLQTLKSLFVSRPKVSLPDTIKTIFKT